MGHKYCKDCGDEIHGTVVEARDETRPNNKTYYHENCVPEDAEVIE